MTHKIRAGLIPAVLCFLLIPELLASTINPAISEPDTSVYNKLEFRSIGPFRGGRSAAVTGISGDAKTYYMGATGGGVWKTTDGGESWLNISDGFFGGTIGAIAVADSDPNIIYAGGGEVTIRGNVSHGYGIWKSLDAGETWKYCGLKEGQYIPRIRIHPRNPDLVYAAVLGHIFGPNPERGIYRSEDGGTSWEKVLFVSDHAGGVDLVLDPFNPRNVFASTWKVLRTPYSLESGGEGSGLWKSTDGGETWTNISRNKGLPEGETGIIGITASPVKRNRLWAIIESNKGGVFRSDDGGRTWMMVNAERSLRQRAWYYTRIYADTRNEDMVYVLNVGFHRSKDGGKSYERIRTPHGDHHDLWIAPEDNLRMIVADDGGAQVTGDAGDNWTTYHNQPTAQFYRVITDNHFPYRIYVAQQDNSTLRISHRSDSRSGITEDDWEETAGGESGHIAPDPSDPEIVYGGSYGGYLMRINHKSNEARLIDVWPDNPMGWGAKDLKYRFQWNFPIFYSHHDEDVLYAAANVLFKTSNEGQSWTAISPDLTRNDSTKLEPSGGSITRDNTSVEYYGTIFAAVESLHEPGVIWTGSDDGLIHITRDGGSNWKDITPPLKIMPEWCMINSIEPHPFEKGGLYVAATSYKWDDFTPYLYKTADYGENWQLITGGIDNEHFTRVIRADPGRDGLLYCGTESGLYISFDDGERWWPLQLNLPVVPVTDLCIKDDDLIIATQGRSLWMLDDLTVLHQLDAAIAGKKFHLFTSRPAYRMSGGGGGSQAGANPPAGPLISFYLRDNPENMQVSIKILEESGELIKEFKNQAEKAELKENLSLEKLDVVQGLNRFAWDMIYPGAREFDNLIMWAGSLRGPRAVPGEYIARLIVENDSSELAISIVPDPRISATTGDYQEQFDFLIEVRDKLTETHETISEIRTIRSDIQSLLERIDEPENESLMVFARQIIKEMTSIEEALYQTRNQSRQDPLNYPIRLNNKLAALASSVSVGSFKPTDQAVQVKEELISEIDLHLKGYYDLRQNDIKELNTRVNEAGIPSIRLD